MNKKKETHIMIYIYMYICINDIYIYTYNVYITTGDRKKQKLV